MSSSRASFTSVSSPAELLAACRLLRPQGRHAVPAVRPARVPAVTCANPAPAARARGASSGPLGRHAPSSAQDRCNRGCAARSGRAAAAAAVKSFPLQCPGSAAARARGPAPAAAVGRPGSGIIALPLANAGETIISAWDGPAIGIDAVCRWPRITHDNVLSMRNRLGVPNRRMAFALRGVCPSRRLAGTSPTDMMRWVVGWRSRDVRRQDHRFSEQAQGKTVLR
jgi:hypothetical protein